MTGETKHTPGPWGIEQTEDTNWIGPMRPYPKVKEIVCSIDREDLKPEALARNDANARLIAAAPELLEACECVTRAFDNLRRRGAAASENDSKQLERAVSIARAAIAKAEGTLDKP